MKHAAKEQKPVPLPTGEAMEQAWKAIDQWFLHYYQLLYFQSPKLTEPGSERGRPFNLKQHDHHRHCLKVECQPWSGRREEFDFVIRPDDTDATVLSKCHLILGAIASEKPKPHALACCPLAVTAPCVCAYAFKCPLHGEAHIGTHD